MKSVYTCAFLGASMCLFVCMCACHCVDSLRSGSLIRYEIFKNVDASQISIQQEAEVSTLAALEKRTSITGCRKCSNAGPTGGGNIRGLKHALTRCMNSSLCCSARALAAPMPPSMCTA